MLSPRPYNSIIIITLIEMKWSQIWYRISHKPIKTEYYLAHLLLIIAPFVIFWFMINLEVELRSQLDQFKPPPENFFGSTAESLSLEEILAQPTPSMEEFELMFNAYGNYYGVNPKQLRHLALCETRFRPHVTNGRHAGLYQYNPTTWSATRERMGLDPNPDLRFDAEEAIKTTAYKIAREGSGAWVVCSNKYYGRS